MTITHRGVDIRHGTRSQLILPTLQSAYEACAHHSSLGACLACPPRILLRIVLSRGDQRGPRWLGALAIS
jgi:hypothetical protein